MSEQPTYEMPPSVLIDTLRTEVARLNDERLSLLSQLTFANTVIGSLQPSEPEEGTVIDKVSTVQ
jgi:hypothetical protein